MTQSEPCAACGSCGTERPVGQMRHPHDMFWRVLTDLWECKDPAACWQAVLAAVPRSRT